QYSMLTRGGVSQSRAASGMTAASLIVFGSLLALPILTLPAILGGAPVERGLQTAAIAGGVLFVLVALGGVVAFLYDRPLAAVARAIQAVRNRFAGKREPWRGLPDRFLAERDLVRRTLGKRWWQAALFASGRWLFDYLALLAALTAVGANPRPSLVLLAYCAAQGLGTLPLTPGGLGFVEAGLTGTLALAGVPGGQAVVATLAYRLVSFWLPIPAGAAAAVLHRRRYGAVDAEPLPSGG
ncbi:MAG TPA: lysylphosphatidylglycerol synthase transmembrane domain-containing protein, partial [Thermoleophilaceae bacterium]